MRVLLVSCDVCAKRGSDDVEAPWAAYATAFDQVRPTNLYQQHLDHVCEQCAATAGNAAYNALTIIIRSRRIGNTGAVGTGGRLITP